MIDLFIQARMGSKRLPNKALLPLVNAPILQHVVDRVLRSHVDRVIIVTTTRKEDDAIAAFCDERKLLCFRGDEENVAKRFFDAAKHFQSKTIIRITADCPCIDPEIIDHMLLVFNKLKVDYASTDQTKDLPRGLDVEIFSIKALQRVIEGCNVIALLEHVTLYMKKNPRLFKLHFEDFNVHLAGYRLCVDTIQDFKLVEQIFKKLLPIHPQFKAKDIFALLQKEPKLASLNSEVKQKCL